MTDSHLFSSASNGASDATSQPQPRAGSGSFLWKGKMIEIRDVWTENLEEEMATIRSLVDKYPYIAMDTEFPGVVARPTAEATAFTDITEYHYQTLRCNVDLLRIIQLGVTFADADGQLIEGCPCWQFNFKFSISEDMHSQDSIELLRRSGLDFDKHDTNGIDVEAFGELMMTSGLVLTDSVRWISFHGGYDFGYLLKVLTCQPLPATPTEFFALLRLYFPCVYDIKSLMNSCGDLRGGLNKLAEDLEIERVGPMHQAGSDSLVTYASFFELRKRYFDGRIDDKHLGAIYGLRPGDIHA